MDFAIYVIGVDQPWVAVLASCTFYDFVIIFQLSSINYFEPDALSFETSQFFSPYITYCKNCQKKAKLLSIIVKSFWHAIHQYGLTT